jgi:CSLREA domain-containing protein
MALFSAAAAHATPYTVDTLIDSNGKGNCSLRDAINAANGSPTSGSTCTTPGTGTDTINFSVIGTISLVSTLPTITDANLTITGPTTSPGITLDGGGNQEVMAVLSGATHIANLTIANGNSASSIGSGISNKGTLTVTNSAFSGNSASSVIGADGFGGGIFNEGGTLTVTNSTFSGNSASGGKGAGASSLGGGIYNHDGTLTVTNSTFSGNSVSGGDSFGGGIFNDGTLTVTNSTFSGNSAGSGEGGGIFNDGTATLKGTILAASTAGNCNGTIDDAGYNISDDGTCGFASTAAAKNGDNVNPQLSAGLFANGGPTETIALRSISPAIGAIPLASCTDQATPPIR